MSVAMYLLGTVLTTFAIMVAMDQFSKYKMITSHNESMRILETFRRAVHDS